jgi:hypothetical protein
MNNIAMEITASPNDGSVQLDVADTLPTLPKAIALGGGELEASEFDRPKFEMNSEKVGDSVSYFKRSKRRSRKRASKSRRKGTGENSLSYSKRSKRRNRRRDFEPARRGRPTDTRAGG